MNFQLLVEFSHPSPYSLVFRVVMHQTAAQNTEAKPMEPNVAIETSALAELWAAFHQDLWKFIRPRVASDAACDDLMQGAFLRAASALNRGTKPDQPRAWLHQIARNLIIDSYRREAVRGAVETSFGDEALEPWTQADADEAGVAEVITRLLPAFVDTLAEPYRTALLLVDLRGLSQVEAANHENVSLPCMKARVQRGRKQLLGALERCCSFELDGRGRPISCSPRSSSPCDPCS